MINELTKPIFLISRGTMTTEPDRSSAARDRAVASSLCSWGTNVWRSDVVNRNLVILHKAGGRLFSGQQSDLDCVFAEQLTVVS